MTPETAPASPHAQREAPGHGSGPPDPPQASHGQRSAKREAAHAWGMLMGEADRLVEVQLEREARLKLIHGSAIDVLATLPDESVHCCVTSPPYWGLRNYGIPDQIWGGDPVHAHIWGEPISVNATNHTDKRRWNHTRNGRGEEQPEGKQVAWLRTDVDQGSFCECGAWRGSLGLEPTPQLFVEHIALVFQEVWRVLRPDGTLWLNLGDSYNAQPGQRKSTDAAGPKQSTNKGAQGTPSRSAFGLKPKDLVGIPWRVAFALQADGWWLRQDIIWHKPNPMPESVKDRCTKAHEYVFLLAKAEKYWYDADAIMEPFVNGEYFHGGYDKPGVLNQAAVRNGRVPKSYNGSSFDKGKTKDGKLNPESVGTGQRVERSGRNKRSVWTLATLPTPEAHFATFPIELPELCILAGCPEGGIVLDPFAGAGTTGLAALKNGRDFLGIELKAEYIEIARARARKYYPLLMEAAG